MMKVISIVSLVIVSMLLVSCSSLQSPCIIGERVTFSEGDIGSETVWKLDSEIYHIKITSTNSISGALVEWDSKSNAYKTTTGELVLSELSGTKFLNFKDDEVYNVHRIVPADNGSIVFYSIDEEELKKYISTGRVESEKDIGMYLLKGTATASRGIAKEMKRPNQTGGR